MKTEFMVEANTNNSANYANFQNGLGNDQFRLREAFIQAGNILESQVLATGGVYLAGGIALHLTEALKDPRFMEIFARKGRFKELMQRIPIHVITTRAALLGAATFGLESLISIRTNA